MAISFIGNANSTVVSSVSSHSISVTVSAGSDRALVVCTHYRDFANNVAISNVTFNTTESFSFIATKTQGAGPVFRGEMWYLLNPTVTTANVVVTWASTAGDQGLAFTVTQLQGVASTSTINTSNTNGTTGTGLAVALTTTVANTLIIDNALGRASGGLTIDGSQTSIVARDMSGSSVGVSRFAQTSAGSKTMQWTQATTVEWVMLAAAFAPASTGVSANVNDTATLTEDVKMHMPISLKMMKLP